MPRLLVLIVLLLFTHLAHGQDSSSEPVTHTVTYGDTLYRIALRYGVSMDDIAAANSLTNQSHLLVGQRLVIPGLANPAASETVENPLVAGSPVIHTVAQGETLNIVARQYGITIDQILQANNIANPNLVYVGQQLNIWTPETVDAALLEDETAANPAVAMTMHTVNPGETLAQIAAQYGVTIADIVTANGMTNANLVEAGQQLAIPTTAVDAAGSSDLGIVSTAPAAPTTEGRYILIDLSDSMVYAYQDGELVYSVLGSMGLPATPTVQGDFAVYARHDAQLMTGPDYYLPNVQWVQYFYSGYALHGTYWHSNWGQPMSHGCVNLPNDAAKWLYDFGTIGTPVRVQA